MKITHLRNATMLLEAGDFKILVDPMLGKKGTAGPPFSFIRFKAQKNPIVDLPTGAMEQIQNTTHCLITHLHPDHLDGEGERFLREKQIPVICSFKDEKALRKKGLNVFQTVQYCTNSPFLGGTIRGVRAVHGYGFVAKPMGNVMGFFLSLPNEKSIYLSSDTIYTDFVHQILTEFKPDISVVAAGRAQLDVFQPLLMHMEDLVKFAQNAPKHVIANHMGAVNHCPTTPEELKKEMDKNGLLDKVFVPRDGESREY